MSEMSKDEIRTHLQDLGDKMSDAVVDDLKDILKAGKTERAKDLLKELSRLKIDVLLADKNDQPLYNEMLQDRIGSIRHVLDEERIVAYRSLNETMIRALRTALAGFGGVASALVSTAVRSAVGGAATGLLGSAGTKLVDLAAESAGKAAEKAVEKAEEKIDEETS